MIMSFSKAQPHLAIKDVEKWIKTNVSSATNQPTADLLLVRFYDHKFQYFREDLGQAGIGLHTSCERESGAADSGTSYWPGYLTSKHHDHAPKQHILRCIKVENIGSMLRRCKHSSCC